MSRSEKQKIKLLKLWEIMKIYSDEDNPLSTKDIIARMKSEGIDVERKTLYDDIKILNGYGYEILCTRGRQNYYYVVDRTFDVPELKILLDAVQAASFITIKKTQDLVKKIANLAGTNRARLLLENIVCFDTRKHTNESIYYSVDTIDRAIIDKKKISFVYFDYNIEGERILRKSGEKYVVNPVVLCFTDNNYYLVCFNDKYKNLSNYRVDRMDKVTECDEDATVADCVKDFDVNRYKAQAFSMFIGNPSKVILLVHNSLIDVIIDRFGENCERTKSDDKHFLIQVDVQVSPTFFSWCSTFGDKIKIVSPLDTVAKYKEFLLNSLSKYSE